MKLFWKALHDALVADATLVSLTGYSASNVSIARENPEGRYKKKGLYFLEGDSKVLDGADTDVVSETEVGLRCLGTTEVECSDILRRVEQIFQPSGSSIQTEYLDITNSEVYCNFSRKTVVGPIVKDEDLDLWWAIVTAEFKWSYK